MGKQADHKTVEPGSNIFRRLIYRQIAGDIALEKEKVPCNTPRSSCDSKVGGTLRKIASTSGSNGIASMSSGEYVRDPGSILSLQPWIFKRSSSHKNEEQMRASGEFVDKCGHEMDWLADSSAVEISPRSIGLGSGPGRGHSTLRSRRPRKRLIKPLTCIENSLIPQLYNENFEIEEYVFSSFSSPTAQNVRPFIVTDGSKIVSKSSNEPLPIPFDIGSHKEIYRDRSRVAETVVGISPLPELRKSKRKSMVTHHEKLGISRSQRSNRLSHSQGLLDRMLLLSIGISIGVLSAALSNKREVDKLRDTLKRTENLVQDLQEELEMKESLTVKELYNEACGGLEEDEDSQKNLPKDESMSKIEAELEAELERLELNMTANNSLEGRIADLDEVDPDLVGDVVVKGELKADMLHHDHGCYSSEDDHGQDSKDSSIGCAHEPNYPVSPRELSLRLHKVIQRRLEDRIKELETALSQSQKQLQMMETERVFSERTFSNSDVGSSSQESPTISRRENSSLAQPFCINLIGDALNAYDEACEEFMRIADSECDIPYTTDAGEQPQRNEEDSVDRNLMWGMEDGRAMKPPVDVGPLKKVPIWEETLKGGEPDRAHESDGDDEDEFSDDDGKLLIQQIVERTKKGSPVFLHAQRMLFAVDDNSH